MSKLESKAQKSGESSSQDPGDKHNLLVGDKQCTIVEVEYILSNCASSGILWVKLFEVARSLGVPVERLATIKRKINTDTSTHSDALHEILVAWRGKFSSSAKLHTLITVLEKHHLNDCADHLRIHFEAFDDNYVRLKLKEFGGWEELPQYLKNWMKSKMVKFQHTQIMLEDLMQEFKTLPVALDTKILHDLSEGKLPCIVNDNVPEHLDYYVPRKVRSRKILKIDVLKETCNDVFVVEGMLKHQLSSSVPKNESTDVSGNQLSRLTVRFIILEHEPDFENICQLTGRPVHWVKYENGRLEFVKSSGSVVNLQEHIHDSQDSFSEEELASRPDRVVVIADSPGMGKTCLLANIAHQIMREQPTMLVRFIVLKEFVDALANKEINVDSVVKQIAEEASEYEFGRKLVENTLKYQDCVLLFDGLDEVLSNQMTTAKKILQTVTTLPSAKLLVATRPHLRDEIENTLHVFGYNMQPFDESNQVSFLVKFWSMKGAIGNDELTKFTQKCVNQLSSNMTDKERNIAGIPLQCRMLAETFEVHAIRCSEFRYDGYESAGSVVMVDSMFGIYERHMELRFEKICEQESEGKEYEKIRHAHMYFALKLLFPEHAEEFKALKSSFNQMNELCGFGIVEATHSAKPQFVHRTFAEYLVAWLAHENIINSSTNRDLILSTIFKLVRQEVRLDIPFEYVSRVKLESFEFNFPVICYFLNGFARKNAPIDPPPIDYNEKVLPFHLASAYHNYENIPHIVTRSVANLNSIETDELSNRDLLYVAARYSDLELMKIFCSNIDFTQIKFREIKKVYENEVFILTPLHVAVRRGHFGLVEYLLIKLEHIAPQLRYLVRFCVYMSDRDSKVIVEDKIQIINKLREVNEHWLNEQDRYQRSPLMQNLVHADLLEYLIQQNAHEDNLNTLDEDGNTLLPTITERNRFTGESYHQIVNALIQRGFQLFNKPNMHRVTPLHLALEAVELLSKTVELFTCNGADLNAVDEEGDSLLFYAVRYKRSVDLMSMMIKLGADTNHRNYKDQNALHISAMYGNLNALEYFIETHKININDQDVNGDTPLHLAALEWKSSNPHYESVMKLLMKLGANVNAENNMRDNPFMYAFESGGGLPLTIIEDMEQHGLNITKSVASNALTAAFLNFDINGIFNAPDVLEYLLEKGGQVEFTGWNMLKAHMPGIIKKTTVTPGMLAESKKHGILTDQDCMELETLQDSDKSNRFYEMAQKKSGSFERVYLILLRVNYSRRP